jgi:hypothetical protein
VGISAGLALGAALLSDAARAEELSAREAALATQASPATGQQRVADTTWKLEKAFSEQFVQGKIDRAALSGAIAEALAAMPEAARPKVNAHIEDVLEQAEKLLSQMTPEQRAEAAAPPPPEKVGTAEQAQVVGWGWPGMGGWGGLGAFGFPGMFGFGGMPFGFDSVNWVRGMGSGILGMGGFW